MKEKKTAVPQTAFDSFVRMLGINFSVVGLKIFCLAVRSFTFETFGLIVQTTKVYLNLPRTIKSLFRSYFKILMEKYIQNYRNTLKKAFTF